MSATSTATAARSAAAATRRAPLLAAYSWLVFAFIYLPIIVLIVYSFNRDGVGGFPPRHLTLDWYRQLFADGAIWTSVLNSLIVAACSVALSLTLGLLAALALDRASFPGKSLFRRLVLLPLILPGIITGLSLLMFAVYAGAHLSLLTVFLGHGTALISVATTELFAGLQKMDRAQEEASLDLGATPLQTVLARDLAKLETFSHCRRPADFHSFHGRNRRHLFSDRPRQHLAAGNLGPPASRNHPGNQCHLHTDFCRFGDFDRDLVSVAHPRATQGRLNKGDSCRTHAATLSNT